MSVDFTVRLPAAASASIKSVSGDIRATGVKGELRVESVSGDITATTAGNLVARQVGVGRRERAGDRRRTERRRADQSVSGDVTVKGLRARGIDVGSVSGEIRLSDVTASRATVKTISGDIEYTGALAKGGRYEMNAHSGDVRLAITDAVGFELDASSFSGTCGPTSR